jgi:hypothetical protein
VNLHEATIHELFAELSRKGVTIEHEIYGDPGSQRFVTVARVPGLIDFTRGM